MTHPLSGQPFSPADHVVVPGGIAVWTQTEFDIVQTLTNRIRLCAASQTIRIWQDAPAKLQRLVNAGIIEQYTINTHPLLNPTVPLVAWLPGKPEPDFKTISMAARTRWKSAAVSTEVFAASRQAANLFGSDSHGMPPIEHRDHDLLLADVYTFYREQRPEVAARWIGEDFFPKAGFQIKDPDAFLMDDDGKLRCVIESAGRYSTQQVASFHDYCVVHDLPYELW